MGANSKKRRDEKQLKKIKKQGVQVSSKKKHMQEIEDGIYGISKIIGMMSGKLTSTYDQILERKKYFEDNNKPRVVEYCDELLATNKELQNQLPAMVKSTKDLVKKHDDTKALATKVERDLGAIDEYYELHTLKGSFDKQMAAMDKMLDGIQTILTDTTGDEDTMGAKFGAQGDIDTTDITSDNSVDVDDITANKIIVENTVETPNETSVDIDQNNVTGITQ